MIGDTVRAGRSKEHWSESRPLRPETRFSCPTSVSAATARAATCIFTLSQLPVPEAIDHGVELRETAHQPLGLFGILAVHARSRAPTAPSSSTWALSVGQLANP